jgi:DNA polymerase III epsilon subunit-like protein
MKNIMIDLETMSTEPNAAILSIGAVVMDFESKELREEFYTNVTLSSCIHMGMHRSESTKDWWAKDENKAARDALTKDAAPIDKAIDMFLAWCARLSVQQNDIVPWSNGAAFDLPIIEHAIKACNKIVPWPFYHQSCFRTMKRLFHSIRVPRTGIKHNALDDAKTQARHLLAILESLYVKGGGGIIYPIDMQDPH